MDTEIITPIANALDQIKDWDVRSFDFDPPKSQFVGDNRATLNVSSLVQKPDFNECKSLSVGVDGKTKKKLNNEQLQELRTLGQFSVHSKSFPGQKHVWSVHRLLQTGTDNIKNSFFDGLANSTKELVINVPNVLYRGNTVTLVKGLKNIVTGFLKIPVLLFGWIDRTHINSNEFIKSQVEIFINNDVLSTIINEKKLENQKFIIESECGYTVALDLLAYHKSLELLEKPYSAFKQQWNLNAQSRFRKYRSDYGEGFDEENLLKKMGELEGQKLQEKIYNFMRSHLNETDAKNLIDLFGAIKIVKKYMLEHEDKKKKAVEQFRSDTLSNHWILSRIPKWLSEKENNFVKTWEKNNPFENILHSISSELQWHEKMIFDLYLEKSESPETKQYQSKLENETEPSQIHTFYYRIWNHKNWIIKKNRYDATVEKYYLLNKNQKYPDATVQKYYSVHNETSYPGWRMVNIGMRIGQLFNNGVYLFIANFIYGKFGLRSLFGLEDFDVDWDYNSDTGSIVPSRKFSTWFGTIADLWKNIRQSRNEFENEHDDGILGKSFKRFFNVMNNYAIKGVVGTSLLLVFYPILILLNTIVSMVGIVASPVWSIVLALLRYLFDIFINDADAPNSNERRCMPLLSIIFDKILLRGLGQCLLSSAAVLIHSFASLGIFLWTLLGNGVNYLYDSMLFHGILKYRAKIPADNDKLVKRISGPGLSMDYYYLVDNELALVLLQIELERMEMDAFMKQTRDKIALPSKKLQRFYEKFAVVGLAPNQQSQYIAKFNNTQNLLEKQLNEIKENYWREHMIKGNLNDREKIKMTKNNLAISLERGTELCSSYVPSKIFSRMDEKQKLEFWSSKNLTQDDWLGLAGHCYRHIFNGSITIPIEEADSKGFCLSVARSTVSDFIHDIFKGNPSDGINTETIFPLQHKLVVAHDKLLVEPTAVLNNKLERKLVVEKSVLEKYLDERKRNEKQVILTIFDV